MTIRRTPIAALLTGLTLVSSPAAQAVVLGEVVSISAVGQPVRIEILSLDGRIDDAGECLRVVTPADTDGGLPTIAKARISGSGSGPNARIVISSPAPMLEPAAQLYVENVCDSRLRRQYTLLLSYPESAPEAVVPPQAVTPPRSAPATARAPTPRAPRAPQTNRWTTAPGESLASLASALYPDDADARQRFTSAAANANPQLFPDRASQRAALPAGTELVMPDMRRVAARAPRRDTAESAPPTRQAAATRGTTPAEPPRREPDRLVVADEPAGASRSQRTAGSAPTPAANDPSWTARERELANAVDRTIVAQMELLARIKELEQLQTELEARAAQLGVKLPAPGTDAPAVAVAPPITPPPAPAEAPAAPPASSPTAAAGERNYGDLGLLGGLGILTIGLVALLLRNRRRDSSDNAAYATPRPAEQSFAPATTRTTAPPSLAPMSEAPSQMGDKPLSSLDPRSLAQLSPAEAEVEEHDSAIELAEIMMSFGRVHGAAETLAEFIRNNPKQAVTPWLKLLEVYRAAGLRAEFDGLARQLNKTFNVKAVTWDNFEDARRMPDSVEKLPHVLARLQQLWGTRECQAYIQTLLRDNRDGTRQGFPLNIIDELLLLAAILEQHLGPYRVEPEAPPPTPGERQAA
ncbi:FimV family protein [Azoarcus sp. DD4]|uniref:type IV pilus assembly protein FimV n=1 Tax=Azoarcus sp. DD4 TaxID=2027405 RepID=UPI001128C1C3|nr:hypothetical protein [Azoarcus sp. DD4]